MGQDKLRPTRGNAEAMRYDCDVYAIAHLYPDSKTIRNKETTCGDSITDIAHVQNCSHKPTRGRRCSQCQDQESAMLARTMAPVRCSHCSRSYYQEESANHTLTRLHCSVCSALSTKLGTQWLHCRSRFFTSYKTANVL